MTTLLDLREILQDDLDLGDEKFITSKEVNRAINRAITDAGATILNMYEDYFLEESYLPLEINKSLYTLPDNIYADKIRRVIYAKHYEEYIIKRILDLDNSLESLYQENDDYAYLLINDSREGVRLKLFPTGHEDTSFTKAIKLAINLRDNFNSHISDITVHTTGVDTADVVTGVTPYNKNLLFDLVYELSLNYSSHQADSAKSSVWSYHTGQELVDSSIPDVSIVSTLKEASERLNEIRAAYILHISSPDSHAIIDIHEITELPISDIEHNVILHYIREPRKLVSDDDILDIPEFDSYIISRSKQLLLLKDPGNPIKRDIDIEVMTQLQLMKQTLSYRQPDDNTDIRIKHDPYSGSIC